MPRPNRPVSCLTRRINPPDVGANKNKQEKSKMNGKAVLKNGCKIVCIQEPGWCEDGSIEAGDTFVYRGESPPCVHQFGPDYERHGRVGGLVGFQINSDDMEEFYNEFRVLAPDED
jgi:hypothetical protein